MEEKEVFAKGMCFKKIFWIFIFGCIFGCVMEMTLHFIQNDGELVSRKGLIYGPFNPVYGLGAVLFTVFLYKRKNIIVIFFLAAILGGLFEFLCSYFQEMLFGTISWDYSNKPLNIGGRTSALYMFYWGCLGVVFIKIVYPFLSKTIEKIPIKIGNIITRIMVIFMIFNCVIYLVASLRQEERKEGVEPQNKVEKIIDEKYPDSRLDKIYENSKDA